MTADPPPDDPHDGGETPDDAPNLAPIEMRRAAWDRLWKRLLADPARPDRAGPETAEVSPDEGEGDA